MKLKILKILSALMLVCLGLLTVLPARPVLAVDWTLTVASTGGGTVTSPGVGVFTYATGTVVSLVATPNAGCTFLSWDGDIEGIANISVAATSITINGDYSILAIFSGSGSGGGGTTTSYSVTATAGANGTISPAGTTTVTSGGSLAFTITPNTGYRVADVLVDGSSVGAVTSYTFNGVVANHTISASFAINAYTVTATAGANGTITPAGSVAVNYGGSQIFTITPAAGHHITGVIVDGASVGLLTTYTFSNVTAAHTISASFAINTYTITATAGANGSISPSGASTVNYGGNQVYTITPNAGYHVNAVLVDGVSSGAVTGYTFTGVIGDHAISASFAINTYAIAASAGAHGAISPAGTTTVNHGGSQTYTITPATGYHIASVLVDGAPVTSATSYPFTSVTAAHTIAVSFAINTYVIKPAAGKHGSIAPFMDVTVDYGDSQIFYIAAETAYRVADVTVDGVSVGAVTSYEFEKVTKDHTIGATFTIGWPYYAAIGLGVVLVFLLGYLAGKKPGGSHL